MSRFRAFGFNLTKEDEKIIKKMFSLITTSTPEIFDLRSFNPEANSDDIIFTYGQRAIKACKELKCLIHVEFPDITRLDATTGDEGERELAYKKLLELKQLFASGKLESKIDTAAILEEVKSTIPRESLPALSSAQIAQLEAILRKKGITSWICEGEDGKTIRITVEPEESNADINLTFRELYALKACTEALQIKEFKIAYKPSTDSSKDNT